MEFKNSFDTSVFATWMREELDLGYDSETIFRHVMSKTTEYAVKFSHADRKLNAAMVTLINNDTPETRQAVKEAEATWLTIFFEATGWAVIHGEQYKMMLQTYMQSRVGLHGIEAVRDVLEHLRTPDENVMLGISREYEKAIVDAQKQTFAYRRGMTIRTPNEGEENPIISTLRAIFGTGTESKMPPELLERMTQAAGHRHCNKCGNCLLAEGDGEDTCEACNAGPASKPSLIVEAPSHGVGILMDLHTRKTTVLDGDAKIDLGKDADTE